MPVTLEVVITHKAVIEYSIINLVGKHVVVHSGRAVEMK
jgi:hypothetical protein